MREPLIHSHITDGLEDYPRAGTTIYCEQCKQMLHCENNECMRTWVETGKGNYCIEDFMNLTASVVEEEWGLPE